MMTAGSGLGEDLFGADADDTIGGPLPNERAVGTNGVPSISADVASRVGDRRPNDLEDVANETPLAHLDRTGDDPLDRVPDIRFGDGDGARVLHPTGINAVDHIGSDDSRTIVETVAGQSAHGDAASTQSDQDHDRDDKPTQESVHPTDGSDDWRIPRWAKVLIVGLVVVFVAAMAFAVLQPVQVLPRIRLAPGYALEDARGQIVTSEDARGTITLYTFVPDGCGQDCASVHGIVGAVSDEVLANVDLAGTEFRTVTLVIGGDASSVERDQSMADGSGIWLAADGNDAENVVGLGFERPTDPAYFTPGFAIVDGWGMIRGEYRYGTLTDDVDKLVRHIDLLGSELRNDHGFASFVYEAAHAFQCYP